MSLERRDLREDLVAVIAAGRELSPEHDYALADIFLRHAQENLRRQLPPPGMLSDPGRVRNLIGAACLAMAVLASALFAFHGGDGDTASTPFGVAPHSRMYDPDGAGGWHDGWWNDHGQPPAVQSPQSPSAPAPPST